MHWLGGFPWMVAFVAAMVAGCSCSESGGGDGLDGGGLPDGAIVLDDGRVIGGCGQEACTLGDTVYCGPIQDPCGPDLVDCGDCPSGLACGVNEPSVCGDPGGTGRDCDEGLCEHQVNCVGVGEHGATTLTGTVYAPDGVTPINDALVYVPNDPDHPSSPENDIPEGATCERCEDEDLGDPIAAAITSPDGAFTLRHVPAGVDFPLVVRVGKWRRVLTIPSTEACASRALPDGDVRLPRNQGEGHIPRIAVSTGNVDALECVLYRMGVDAAEFTRPPGEDACGDGGAGGTGRIHLYRSSGAWADSCLESACNNFCSNDNDNCGTEGSLCDRQLTRHLYRDQTLLDSYDMVFFSCDHPLNEDDRRDDQWHPGDYDRVRGYADKGGRLFLSHWNYQWMDFDPAPDGMSNLADFSGPFLDDLAGGDQDGSSDVIVDTSFPRGLTFAQWLDNLGALTDPLEVNGALESQIHIHQPRAHVVETTHTASQRWTHTIEDPHGEDADQSFTFEMPMDASADQTCGRGVYTAFHVSRGPGETFHDDYFPDHCATGPLTPQELALVFKLFDLGACITETREPPGGCTPRTCDDAGAQCGQVVDGCGGIEECGGCPDNHLCNPATNQCEFVG
jgi:hypothetical protein